MFLHLQKNLCQEDLKTETMDTIPELLKKQQLTTNR